MSEISEEEEARKWKNEGNKRMQEKRDYNGAVESYTRAIELDNTKYIYYNNRAMAYMRLGEYNNVLKDCDASLALKDNTRAYTLRSNVLSELGYLDDALESADKALEYSPDCEEANVLKTLLVDSLEQAKRYVEEAIRMTDGSEPASADYDAAIERYTKAISLYKSNFRYYNRRAAAYFQSGDIENGLRDCDSSLQIHENARAYCLKASALGEQANVAEGIKCIDKALSLAPTDKQSLITRENLLSLQSQLSPSKHCRNDSTSARVNKDEKCKEHYDLAQMNFQYGRHLDVVKNCTQSLYFKEHCDAYCLQAKAYVHLNRIDDAFDVIHKSLCLNSTHEESLEIENYLIKYQIAEAKRGDIEEFDFVSPQYKVYDEEENLEKIQAKEDKYDDDFVCQQHENLNEIAAESKENIDFVSEQYDNLQFEEKVVKPLQCISLYREPSHDECLCQPLDDHYEDSRRSSVNDEIAFRRRSLESIVASLPEPIAIDDDDGELIDSMGIQFRKLITTPQAFEVLKDGYDAVAHKYSYKVGDLVTTYNLPTIIENNLSGVVTGPKNKDGKYPVFVEYHKKYKKQSITRYYYPENLWSKMRADIRNDRVDNPDQKFRVPFGINMDHEYHYDSIPAEFGTSLEFSYVIDDSEDVNGSWNWTHDEIRQAMDNMKIEQEVYIHAPEKYDNPVPKFKPYKITFLKNVETLDT